MLHFCYIFEIIYSNGVCLSNVFLFSQLDNDRGVEQSTRQKQSLRL